MPKNVEKKIMSIKFFCTFFSVPIVLVSLEKIRNILFDFFLLLLDVENHRMSSSGAFNL